MTQSDIAVLSSKLEYLQEKISDIHTMIGDHIKEEKEEKAKEAEKKTKELEQQKKDFSLKWVEKVMTYVLVAIWCSLLGWFITQQTSINEFLLKNNYNSSEK